MTCYIKACTDFNSLFEKVYFNEKAIYIVITIDQIFHILINCLLLEDEKVGTSKFFLMSLQSMWC